MSVLMALPCGHLVFVVGQVFLQFVQYNFFGKKIEDDDITITLNSRLVFG
jgi:hypothetical protein